MDPQTPNFSDSAPVETPISPEVPKDKHGITIAAMAIFVLLALGAVAFLYYQNQQLKILLASYQTPVLSPTPIATPDPTTDWKTFTNTASGISFKYPNNVTLKETQKDALLTDSSKDFQFTISWNFVPLTTTLREELVSRDQCPAGVAPEGLVAGPIPNSLRCDFTKSHYASVMIWVQNGTKMYKADIGAINPDQQIPQDKIDLLNQILSTFKFVSPSASPSTKPIACTQEAKICPDGSSVGRTGPNCEFAPCPY